MFSLRETPGPPTRILTVGVRHKRACEEEFYKRDPINGQVTVKIVERFIIKFFYYSVVSSAAILAYFARLVDGI